MKYLGIDYGEKRVGVAFGDDVVKVATPFLVLDNSGLDGVIRDIEKIINDEGIEFVVVGMPYALSGKDEIPGMQEEETNNFIAKLGLAIDIPIVLEDERFTSVQVDQLMAGRKIPGKKRDAVSAMLILQSYLDKL